ncbi:MAG: alpha-L-fucosidase, partial [Bacteroidetes bacterium]|nr:alpha-L-fucosidase [Bacteroidota bacterium]
MTKWIVLIFVILIFACNVPNKTSEQSVVKYEPNWESLKKIPVAPWFEDAKFGIFIHWGGFSVIGHRKGGT